MNATIMAILDLQFPLWRDNYYDEYMLFKFVMHRAKQMGLRNGTKEATDNLLKFISPKAPRIRHRD